MKQNIVRIGMETPWGKADQADTIAPGIGEVSTSSHGGIHVSRTLNKKIHEALREDSGWYEEDSGWAIPFYFLKEEIKAAITPQTQKRIEQALGGCEKALKEWHPGEFEAATGIRVRPDESGLVRETMFHKANKGKLMAVAAWGDWQAGVPKNMVGVCARVDGNRDRSKGDDRWFLVPAAEYAQRKHSFIVDPVRHPKVKKFT